MPSPDPFRGTRQMPRKSSSCITSLPRSAALRPKAKAKAKRSFVQDAANGRIAPELSICRSAIAFQDFEQRHHVLFAVAGFDCLVEKGANVVRKPGINAYVHGLPLQ